MQTTLMSEREASNQSVSLNADAGNAADLVTQLLDAAVRVVGHGASATDIAESIFELR